MAIPTQQLPMATFWVDLCEVSHSKYSPQNLAGLPNSLQRSPSCQGEDTMESEVLDSKIYDKPVIPHRELAY